MANKIYAKTERSLQRLQGMLITEFVLGVILTTVLDYNPEEPNTLQTIVLAAHIFVGVGLIIASIVHLVAARKEKLLGAKPWIGLFLILGANGAGSVAAQSGDDTAVLTMALCFIGALAVYGRSYVLAKTGKA